MPIYKLSGGPHDGETHDWSFDCNPAYNDTFRCECHGTRYEAFYRDDQDVTFLRLERGPKEFYAPATATLDPPGLSLPVKAAIL